MHVQAWIDEQLPALLEKYDVPAAAWAVLADGEVVDGAAGCSTRPPASRRPPTRSSRSARSPSSGPARWSCSWSTRARSTSTCRSAPTCRSSGSATRRPPRQITTRQLLTHTAGFEGDIFTDTGVGDDCVEKYLGVLTEVPAAVPAGRAVLLQQRRLLRARPPRRGAPREDRTTRACASTSSRRSASPTRRPSPYEAIMFRAAMGHVELEPGGGYEPAPFWALARSNAPAGSMLAMRPRDLLAFARHAPRGRPGRGRHPGARARHRRADAGPRGRPARPRPDGHLVGPRLRAVRHPRRRRSSATTAAPSARTPSCAWSPRPASRSRC